MKKMKMKPGWGFIVKTPDGTDVKATFLGWEGRRVVFSLEFPEGTMVVPFKGDPPPGPAGRPHRSVRNATGLDVHGDVDGNR